MSTVEYHSTLAEHVMAWDALLDQMARPSPFLRSWWLEAVRGPGTEFVLAFDGGELIGGIPLTMDRKRAVKRCRFAGSGALAPHNLDLLATVGAESEVRAALDAYLAYTKPGIIDLFGIDPDCAIIEAAPSTALIEQIDGAPWIDVPADFETFVASRRRKLRQEIRRVGRRLGETGLEYRETAPADLDRALATFEQLHVLRWGDDSLLLPELAVLTNALRAGARRGEVSFQEVVTGDRVVASLVAFEVAGVSSWYQMGRDPDPAWSNCGTFLKAKAVERSCRLGHARIDLCIGTAPQKVEWSDGQQAVVRVRWARGTAERAALRGLVALENLAETVRARRAAAV